MKKSGKIVLGALFMAAVQSCNNQPRQPEWITGYGTNGKASDTVVGGRAYRYYNHGYYPVSGGFICPGYYRRPYTFDDISRTGFTPEMPAGGFNAAKGVTTGGFGSSAGEAAGE